MNNMLRVYLYLEDNPIPRWIDKMLAIMLTLNSMPHQPHGYSVSMIATSHEKKLPPNLITGLNLSEAEEDPSAYVGGIFQKSREVYQ